MSWVWAAESMRLFQGGLSNSELDRLAATGEGVSRRFLSRELALEQRLHVSRVIDRIVKQPWIPLFFMAGVAHPLRLRRRQLEALTRVASAPRCTCVFDNAVSFDGPK